MSLHRSVVVAAGAALTMHAWATPCAAQAEDDAPPQGGHEPLPRPHRLFREARALMERGEYDKAAALLEEALKELPGKGISFQLAVCYERMGRFASAWARFQEVAYLEEGAGDEARAQIARSRALAIAASVPHVTIAVTKPVEGLVVQHDGVPVASATWGTAVPLDPGRVVVSASAPGRKDWQTTIDLRPGQSERVEVPELDAAVAPLATATAAPTSERAAVAPEGSSMTPRRVAALSIGGLGVVGIATGVVFALDSMSTYRAADAYCDASNHCTDPRGVTLRQSSIDDGNVATIAIGLGAAAVVAGAVLWFTGAPSAPSAKRPPSVGVHATARGTSLVLGATW
jgi:serine/threonine-protein kinase